MRRLALSLILASCGAPAPAPTSPPAPDPATAPAAQERAVADAPPWQWEGGEPGAATTFYQGPITVDDPGGMRCSFRYEESDHTDHLECLDRSGRRAWGYDRAGAFVEDAALHRHGEVLYMARFSNISTGCELSAYDLLRGERRWTRRLRGVGAIGNSEYLNDVQLRWIGGHIVAFGWESGGQYVEALDPTHGALVAYRGPATGGDAEPPSRAEPPMPGEATMPWRWDGAQPEPQGGLYAPESVATPSGRCTFVRDDRGTHLACEDASGRRVWGDDVAGSVMSDAALATDGTRLFVSRFSNMASGSYVTAYDVGTGQQLWQTSLRGAGPVVHSIYLHDEQLRVEGGRVIAIGWELAGRWIEVLDPATGADLGNRLLAEGE